MSDEPTNPKAPPPNSLPQQARRTSPSRRRGAAQADAVPRMETVRITAPDLRRRAALEITRTRLVVSAAGFLVLFLAVALKLADATIIQPLKPHRPERPLAALLARPQNLDADTLARRAMITDRNGQILAISLPTAELFADPRQIVDPAASPRGCSRYCPISMPPWCASACGNRQAVRLPRSPHHPAAGNRDQ